MTPPRPKPQSIDFWRSSAFWLGMAEIVTKPLPYLFVALALLSWAYNVHHRLEVLEARCTQGKP